MNAKLKEWQFLHKQMQAFRAANNWAAINGIKKRIEVLKPWYTEFSQQHETTQPSTRLPHDTTQPSTPCQPEEDAKVLWDSSGDHRAFHFYAVAGSAHAAVLCDRVFTLWKKARNFKRTPSANSLQDYYRIVETIVANLLYCQAMQHDGVRFSRCREVYAAPSRYRPVAFNERFLTVLDDLNAMGIVQQTKGDRLKPTLAQKHFPGDHHPKVYGLKQSFIVPGQALVKLQSTLSLVPSMYDIHFVNEDREVIILKKGEGSQLLEYRDEDFPEAMKSRKQLQIINEMLKNAGDIVIPEGRTLYDQRQRHLVRRFTHSSTESGGRLWEGFWINGMKRTARPSMLRLNGESTVELDFSSMIVRLAYIVAEKPAPAGDQYGIPGLDPESRDGIKKVLGALLFDSSKKRDRLPKDTAKLFTTKDQAKGWKQIYKAIHTHHYELRAYLDRGLGHYLQFLESQVLVNVLLRCSMEGITALPLHDCVIVPRSQAPRTKAIMGYTVRYMFGKDASIPVVMKGIDEGQKQVA